MLKGVKQTKGDFPETNKIFTISLAKEQPGDEQYNDK